VRCVRRFRLLLLPSRKPAVPEGGPYKSDLCSASLAIL
jgi:hypothetical protein